MVHFYLADTRAGEPISIIEPYKNEVSYLIVFLYKCK